MVEFITTDLVKQETRKVGLCGKVEYQNVVDELYHLQPVEESEIRSISCHLIFTAEKRSTNFGNEFNDIKLKFIFLFIEISQSQFLFDQD